MISNKHILRKTLTFILAFIAAASLYSTFLLPYASYISHYGSQFASSLNQVMTLILAYFIYAGLNYLWTGHIHPVTLFTLYTLYGITLIYVLFFKNIGVQGYSFDPFSFITDIENGSRFVPFMNLIMFIPLGTLFHFNKRSFSLAFLAILTIESIQYIFHLGIFDLGDVTLNLTGFLFGSLLTGTLAYKKIKNKNRFLKWHKKQKRPSL